MDLAQSILKELITLQNKNEELARIITKLEHESDIIIQQFERKIEELQKSLKHEQDDKARAARRYEEEIRDLEESKTALIHETADIRETFQNHIAGLGDQIETLTRTLNDREEEFSNRILEKEKLISEIGRDLAAVQAAFSAYRSEAEREHNDLFSRIKQLLAELDQERRGNAAIIKRKDDEFREISETLKTVRRDLKSSENREASSKEKSEKSIANLHDLLTTERQIRSREIRERDTRIAALEEESRTAVRSLSDLNDALIRSKKESGDEISRMQGLISDDQAKISLFKKEIFDLHSQITLHTRTYEAGLKESQEKFLSEKKALQESLSLLEQQLKTTQALHTEQVMTRDAEITTLRQKISDLEEEYEQTLAEHEDETIRLSETISVLHHERSALTKQIADVELENTRLFQGVQTLREASETERKSLLDEIDTYQCRISENEQNHKKETGALQEQLNRVLIDRDQVLTEKEQLEEYYRGEISVLHNEIAEVNEGAANRENSLLRDIAERDTRVTALSVNNEALRSELERLSNHFRRLQETIRAEKDESVHALYQEITSLEEKLSEKNRENVSLSDRLIRLDGENTRLLQALSETSTVSTSLPEKKTGTQPDSPSVQTEIPKVQRGEIAALVADLDDPVRAPAAAEQLTAMGGNIVDQLIPLLHSGSIQRRVWIAVVLYELNDNRATLPLMKLLETPKVHFRELIWEAKTRYHSRAAVSSSAAGVRITPDKPGLF
jgi:chromosome segregation ATPase